MVSHIFDLLAYLRKPTSERVIIAETSRRSGVDGIYDGLHIQMWKKEERGILRM